MARFSSSRIDGTSTQISSLTFELGSFYWGEARFQEALSAPDTLASIDGDPLTDWAWDFHPKLIYEKTVGTRFKASQFADPWARNLRARDLNHNAFALLPESLTARFPRLSKRMRRWNRPAELDVSNYINATLVALENRGDYACFIYSTGSEIHLYDYWECCRRRYGMNPDRACREHPAIGQTVVSVNADSFPNGFYMWFDNARKLDIAYDSKRQKNYRILPQGIGR